MFKKIFAAVFTICAILGFACIHAEAAQQGDWEYKTLSDGTVEIVKYSGKDAEVMVPDKIGGKKVTRIGKCCFMQNRHLVEVTVPKGITSIGLRAFQEDENLVKITLPEGIASIGQSAFQWCTKLERVALPEGLTCIEGGTFELCSSLEELTIPSSVTEIKGIAINNCSRLREIRISEGVRKIDYWNFLGCESLENIFVSEENKSFSSRNGMLMDKKQTSILRVPEGKACIPDNAFDGVTKIGGCAFYENREDRGIVIPDGVMEIGEFAFHGCDKIPWISIPDSVTVIGDSAFSGCGSISSMRIPGNVTEIRRELFEECSNLTEVLLPDGITQIEYNAFCGCGELQRVNIPKGVTEIEYGAFRNCSSLSEITIPEGVTIIRSGLFSDCKSLKSIKLPDSITEIEDEAFSLSGLENIKLPDGVMKIGDKAFSFCDLASIEMPDSVMKIGNKAFASCNLVSIVMPDSVTELGTMAFSSCHHLENIILSKGLTRIGGGVFWKCENLKNIEIPEGVTSFTTDAFADCTGLEWIDIPKSVNRIEETSVLEEDDGYFSGCTNLKSINVHKDNKKYSSEDGVLMDKKKTEIIACPPGKSSCYEVPQGVRVICGRAFSYCSSLESIDIPRSVEEIQADSSYGYFGRFSIYFKGCTNLKSINVHKDNKTYSSEDGVLMNKKKTEIIACPPGKSSYYKVPKSVKTIGSGAFWKCNRLQGLEIGKNVTKIADREALSSGYDIQLNALALPSLILKKGSYAESFAKKNKLKYTTAVYVKSVKAKKKAAAVTWNKFKKASGYQIRYSLYSDMSESKTINISAEKTSKTIKKLKAGKKYYIQIRAVLKDSETGKDIYTSWSSKKSIKVKP